MRWQGETEAQWEQRVSQWHPHFCLIPRQMPNGGWIWLERIWARRKTDRTFGGALIVEWEFSEEPYVDPPRSAPPPPPKK